MKNRTRKRPTAPATSAWVRKSAPRVGSTVSKPCSSSDSGSAPKRSVLYRFVRSASFAGFEAPTVMIVVPAQIGSLMVGTVMTCPSSAIGPGRSTFAVVNWHQVLLASSLRANDTPIWLPAPTSGATLPCWISPPLNSSVTAPDASRSLMSWPSVSCCPCGSTNWSWPVEPTRSRSCASSETPGTSTMMRRDPSPAISERTWGSVTPMPATRRSRMSRVSSRSSAVTSCPSWGITSRVTRLPPCRSRPSTVRNSVPRISSGSQPRPSVTRGRVMKIATRAITPMTHGAIRRQVMSGSVRPRMCGTRNTPLP